MIDNSNKKLINWLITILLSVSMALSSFPELVKKLYTQTDIATWLLV